MFVIPGWSEGPDPESRDSGFDASHRPGMTAEGWGQGGMMAGKLTPTHEAPYRGLRVLDFGQGIASPYCAMLLGVYGADVIKVEPPEGDWSRFLGTTYGNHTTLSAVYHRGKRSLCLDMTHTDGIAIARRLARDC